MRFLIFIILLSAILMLRFYHHFSIKPTYKVGQQVELTYTFLSEPKVRRSYQIFSVGNIQVYATRYPEFHYGDRVRISGKLEDKMTLKNPKIEPVTDFYSSLLFPLYILRKRFSETFNSFLPSQESSLLLGIVFGIKGDFDKAFSDNLRLAGVLHVIAASGMNVSMVGQFLLLILARFLKRRLTLLLTSGGIIFYAVVSGLAPSIVRASFMAIAAFSAQSLGRQNLSVLNLFIAAWLMLMFNPELIFDVGFELSFAATLGILFIKPVIDKLKLLPAFFQDDFSTTVSAQLTTLPILLTAFTSFSAISIVANTLVLWTIPPLMILGGIAAIVSILLPIFAAPFLYLSYPLLLYFEKTVTAFAAIGKPLTVESFPITIAIGYYLLLAAIFLRKRKL